MNFSLLLLCCALVTQLLCLPVASAMGVIHLAARKGEADLVRTIIDAGVNVDFREASVRKRRNRIHMVLYLLL